MVLGSDCHFLFEVFFPFSTISNGPFIQALHISSLDAQKVRELAHQIKIIIFLGL